MAALRVRAILAVPAAALLAACAPTQSCLLPAQQPMLKIDLYFGRDVPGRAPVSDAEWARFASGDLTASFPDGFTVLDATGQWLNPDTHDTAHEATRLVEIATPWRPDLAARVRGVTDVYKARFNQQSVGVVSVPGCAAF